MSDKGQHVSEPEFIDKGAWVPLGQDVIPAAQLLNERTVLVGRCYRTTDTSLLDRLLEARLIDDSYYSMALRIVNLFRLATTKNNYAAPTIFRGAFGSGNSDYCPMTVFQRVTRSLNRKDLVWVYIVCEVVNRPYDLVAENIMLLKHVLETLEENFANYEGSEEQANGGGYHDQV